MANCEASCSHIPNRSYSTDIIDDVKHIIKLLVDKIEQQEAALLIEEIIPELNKNKSETKAKGKLEIVSEETIIDPVKLVVNQSQDLNTNTDNKLIKWAGARIQRNVKLLPKRIDKKIEKRKSEVIKLQNSKKSKHEIIELSDDEIEEIPRKMSRMEMLNCLPNIASKDCITQIISRAYIPHSIKPIKSVYEYDRARLQLMQETNKNLHINSNTSTRQSENSNSHYNSRNTIVPYSRSRPPLNSPRDNNWRNYNRHSQNGHPSIQHTSLNSQTIRGTHLNNFYQHKVVQNYYMGSNRQNYVSNRWSSFQVNVFKNIAMAGYAIRTSLMQTGMNMFQHMINSNSYQQRRPDTRRYDSLENSNNRRSHSGHMRNHFNNNNNNNYNDVYESSFVKMTADSWSELKKKWKESKTITIEDEDDKMDCSEVEVVNQTVQPLVGAKNAGSLAEIYEKLRIIKPAQEKIMRKKKGDYKISYKVYSNTKHYKKSDPGTPMFHLIITRFV